jgi:amino acid transporter
MAVTEPPAQRTRGRLRPEAVGVAGIVFFVISAAAPLTGVAGAAPVAIAIGDGPGLPGAYVVAGLILLLFSVGYATMSAHVTNAGAFYAYIGRGLGRRMGLGSAIVALLGYQAIQAAMYGLAGFFANLTFADLLGITLPWYVWALIFMAVIQLLGYLSVDVGARVLAVLVAAETLILLALAFGVLFRGGGPEGLGFAAAFNPSNVFSGAAGVAIMFALASFVGFEATAIYGEEAKDPTRTVPRATYLAISLITVFFAFVTWSLVSFHGASSVQQIGLDGLTSEAADATGPIVFAAASDVLGSWSGDVISVLLITSLFAGMLAFHNAVSRYFYALGRDGVFPPAFGRTHSRHQSPYVASFAQTAVALVFVVPFALTGSSPYTTLFTWFSGLAVVALSLLQLLTSIAVIVFFQRTKLDTRPWQTLIAPALATLALGAALWLVLDNFGTLINRSETFALWFAALVPLAFAVGIVLSFTTKQHTAGHEAELDELLG